MNIDYLSLIFGIATSYPLIVLLIMVVPDMTTGILFFVGLFFFASGLISKTTTGWFYIQARLEDNPSKYWHNMGQSLGMIFFSYLGV